MTKRTTKVRTDQGSQGRSQPPVLGVLVIAVLGCWGAGVLIIVVQRSAEEVVKACSTRIYLDHNLFTSPYNHYSRNYT